MGLARPHGAGLVESAGCSSWAGAAILVAVPTGADTQQDGTADQGGRGPGGDGDGLKGGNLPGPAQCKCG